MDYVLTFCAGTFLGFILSAIVPYLGYNNKIQDAYDEGYKKGLENKK